MPKRQNNRRNQKRRSVSFVSAFIFGFWPLAFEIFLP